MDPNRPLTMKEAALRAAEAAKPPFDPKADKRHIIASAIRLAGEATGQSEQAAESADEFQQGSPMLDEAGQQEMLGRPEQQPQTSTDSLPSGNVPIAGDFSSSDAIVSDQADAGQSAFMPPPIGADGNDSAPADSPSWSSDASAQSAGSALQPAFPEHATSFDVSAPPNTVLDNIRARVSAGIASFEGSQVSPSTFGTFHASSVDSTPPPVISDMVYRKDQMDSDHISQLPWPADERGKLKIQLMSAHDAPPQASEPSDGEAPVSYRSFAETAAASNGDRPPVEKHWLEFESNPVDVKKDAVIAFMAMEPALLKAFDKFVEQDRHDTFLREATRRACL